MKPEIPLVQADEEKISWAILQLIENAIKFTPSGGQGELYPSSLKSDTLIMVSVTDTGIGIPANRMNEIYEPFPPIGFYPPPADMGVPGWDLPWFGKLLLRMARSIEVQSEDGKGTRFRFPLLRQLIKFLIRRADNGWLKR